MLEGKMVMRWRILSLLIQRSQLGCGTVECTSGIRNIDGGCDLQRILVDMFSQESDVGNEIEVPHTVRVVIR